MISEANSDYSIAFSHSNNWGLLQCSNSNQNFSMFSSSQSSLEQSSFKHSNSENNIQPCLVSKNADHFLKSTEQSSNFKCIVDQVSIENSTTNYICSLEKSLPQNHPIKQNKTSSVLLKHKKSLQQYSSFLSEGSSNGHQLISQGLNEKTEIESDSVFFQTEFVQSYQSPISISFIKPNNTNTSNDTSKLDRFQVTEVFQKKNLKDISNFEFKYSTQDSQNFKSDLMELMEFVSKEEDGPEKQQDLQISLPSSLKSQFSQIAQIDQTKILTTFGNIDHEQYYFQKSRKFYLSALSKIEQTSGQKSLSYANILNNLANIEMGKVNSDQALRYYLKANQIYQKQPSEAPLQWSDTLNNIGSVYESKHQHEAALKYYNKSLEIRRENLGLDHSKCADVLNNIGVLQNNRKNYQKALEYYKEAYNLRNKNLKSDVSFAQLLNNIGTTCFNLNNHEKAREFYFKSLTILQSLKGKNHIKCAHLLNNIANVYDNQGYFDIALQYYQKSLDIKLNVMGKQNARTADTHSSMGISYIRKQDTKNALKSLNQALEIKEKLFGRNHIKCADTLMMLGKTHLLNGKIDQAEQYFTESYQLREKYLSSNHPRIADSYLTMAIAYFQTGNTDQFYSYYRKYLQRKLFNPKQINRQMDEIEYLTIHELRELIQTRLITKDYYIKAMKIFDKYKIQNQVSNFNILIPDL